MAQAPQPEPLFTAERYFALVDEGVLQPDDRVELLEGVIVAMPPQSPPHAGYLNLVAHRLSELVGGRATVRTQGTLPVSILSVPEPDVAVVPGTDLDYLDRHPTTALLLVEVAVTSLPQDRLTKAAIYAAAGIPEYWIVNLRDRALEILREPDPRLRLYARRWTAAPDEVVALAALPDVRVPVASILPPADAVFPTSDARSRAHVDAVAVIVEHARDRAPTTTSPDACRASSRTPASATSRSAATACPRSARLPAGAPSSSARQSRKRRPSR